MWIPSGLELLVFLIISIAFVLLTVLLGSRGRRVLGLVSVFVVGLGVIAASLLYVSKVSTGSLPPPHWPNPCQDHETWKAMEALEPDVPEKTWVAKAPESDGIVNSKVVLGIPLCWREPDFTASFTSSDALSPGYYIVGLSQHLEPREELARKSARASVEDNLKALVLSRLDDSWMHPAGGNQIDVAALVASLDHLVHSRCESLIDDRFDQSLERPYGTVYRSAILARADPDTILGLTQDLRKAIDDGQVAREGKRQEVLWTVGSAVGLGFVVFLLYALLNAGTKGFFAWPLRIFALLALGLFYLGAMYWKGWISG